MQGRPVYLVEGDAGNRKITVPADLAWAEARLRDEQSGRRLGAPADGGAWRVGSGYDIHRLVEGRRLVLGGVEIPWERGLLGHSDADVLLHAAMDAILGAMAAGDIGRHFPDTSPEWAGADSAAMLRKVVQMMKDQGWQVENLDATVIAQQPRLAPHVGAMRERMAGLLEVEPARVGIKAKTNEGLDAVGRGEAIAAQAVVLLRGRKGA
ncbi:MAG: 2-C-methyl-D-erythritol 2,4-cyclodiphosphate synthase [Firmicutes bacterium]|nr:2-C-methyl-D-erythritol 2,4-cyclodiphosphate synthase [Bacillota bacterium]